MQTVDPTRRAFLTVAAVVTATPVIAGGSAATESGQKPKAAYSVDGGGEWFTKGSARWNELVTRENLSRPGVLLISQELDG